MFDESSELSVYTLVVPEEGLGYGPVVPFPAYGFASLVSHNESHSPNTASGGQNWYHTTLLIGCAPPVMPRAAPARATRGNAG
eukprot:scaffold72899_cov60-Phaeocystis_antarctica.AAC.3